MDRYQGRIVWLLETMSSKPSQWLRKDSGPSGPGRSEPELRKAKIR